MNNDLQDDRLVLVFTGPAGAGKSTTARNLAKELGKCVDIDIEHINYMIVEGFQHKMTSNGEDVLSFNKWDIAGDTIGALADHFLNAGYRVIIHGHVTNELLCSIENRTPITYRILLLPGIETVISRDKNRGEHLSMGESMVRQHYSYFTNDKWDSFIKIDTTNDKVGSTISKIRKIISI
ncbi:hypothetical protein CYG49_01455 [Candidatus Saccharibacteria bacterium]|nr:MAG: hypothetical protein CYG49_01455 [Candidatus Saccharibacteria bacterium]